jgi:hypothetical protein
LKYKVTFRQRFDEEGDPTDSPERLVDAPDGVILDAVFVEQIESPALHVEEKMEEDDNWLAFGTSTWIFDVADGRDQEFKDALALAELVIHVETLNDTPELMT